MGKDLFALELGITSVFLLMAFALTATHFSAPANAANTTYFNVSLVIGNSAPVVRFVDAVSDSPAEGTTKVVTFYFNATDDNGVADIPAANGLVKINQSGVELTSAACSSVSTSTTERRISCPVTINYYNLPGTWTINASIYDGSATTAVNLSYTGFTMGYTYAISLKTDSLTFSGSPGQNDLAASNNPQVVNNTGNGGFATLNLTSFNLVVGAYTLGAGNFTVNTTAASPLGQQLANATNTTLTNSDIAVLGHRNISVYVDIPSGIINGNYLSQYEWVITAS